MLHHLRTWAVNFKTTYILFGGSGQNTFNPGERLQLPRNQVSKNNVLWYVKIWFHFVSIKRFYWHILLWPFISRKLKAFLLDCIRIFVNKFLCNAKLVIMTIKLKTPRHATESLRRRHFRLFFQTSIMPIGSSWWRYMRRGGRLRRDGWLCESMWF